METACSIPVNYDGYIRAKERTETMHQRRLGLNIEQHLLRRGQLSLKRKTAVANQAKDRSGLKTKSPQWGINDGRFDSSKLKDDFKKNT